MTYEVEIKFPLDGPPLPIGPGRRTGPETTGDIEPANEVPPSRRDLLGERPGVRDIVSRLERLGACRQSPVEQVDRYFNHPQRDFARTDEALRLRVVGEDCFVTYKGPLVDAQTKTRREIEVPVGGSHQDAKRFGELLAALGFEEIRTVRKSRVPIHLRWEDRDVELALDEVEGLGTFLEIEASADESQRDEVRDSLLRLAGKLGLENSIRTSYLTLLLQRDRQ